MKISRGKSSGSNQRISGVSGKKADGKVDQQAGQQQDQVETSEPAVGVSLSDMKQVISSAKAAIQQVPDVRVEKVDEIRLSVDEGSYQVESVVVAKRMVDESLRESARFFDKTGKPESDTKKSSS